MDGGRLLPELPVCFFVRFARLGPGVVGAAYELRPSLPRRVLDLAHLFHRLVALAPEVFHCFSDASRMSDCMSLAFASHLPTSAFQSSSCFFSF
jgi:hypothetical protein